MRRLLRWTTLLLWLLAAAVVSCLAYLTFHGFPEPVCQFVRDQFRQKGYAVQFESVRLDWLNGISVRNLVLADAKRPGETIASVNEVALRFDLSQLWSRQNLIRGLRVSHANITAPMPPDHLGSENFTATDANATLRFEDGGVIRIEHLSGTYCGVFLTVSGRLKPGALAEPPKGPNRFAAVSTALRELRGLRCREPLNLRLDFNIDLAQPMALQAQAGLRGTQMRYRDLAIDALDINVAMEEGALRIEKADLALAGGKLTVHGTYDITGGQADLNVTSTFDPLALRPLLPAAADKPLQLLRLHQNPHIRVRYQLSPQTGSIPLLTGSVKTGPLDFRGVHFRGIAADFENRGPLITVTRGHIVMPEGELNGHGRYHIESSDFNYQLDSTLDPTKLIPLMTPIMQRWVSPSVFLDPPHIIASVRGDFVDPDLFAYDAEVHAGRCSYRGVPVKSASGILRLRRNRLLVRDLALERDDGKLTGTLTADFDNQHLIFNMRSTADPAPMAALLGPKAAKTMEPYHFGTNLHATAKGFIDFAHPDRVLWSADATDDNFAWWKLTSDRAHAQLRFTNNLCLLHLDVDGLNYGSNRAARATADLLITTNAVTTSNIALTIGTGEVRGAADTDLKRQLVNFQFHSTANPHALAALLGPAAAKKIAAYQFGTNTIVHAKGLADLIHSNETTWSATLDTDSFRYAKLATDHLDAALTLTNEVLTIRASTHGFQWWKLKTDQLAADLVASNTVLTVRNLEGSLCGGKLRGDADLLTLGTNSTFRLALDASQCDITRVLKTIGSQNTNASGHLNVTLALTGTAADLATYTGGGKFEIIDGVLVEVPLFGVFSRILNLIAPGLGSTAVTSARCTYSVTNQLVKTDDLQLDTAAATVSSRGSVGFPSGELDFRVEAQPLRSWPGINILTWMFGKIFEYKVGGSLGNPNWRPTRLPKEILPHSEGHAPATTPP